MSKRLFIVIALVLFVGFFTRAFAYAQEILSQPEAQPLTRAEAVALLLNSREPALERTRWFASHMPPMSLFKDVEQTQWYAPYLETAFQAGLIEGTTDSFFRPNDRLTQEEAITLSSRWKRLTSADPASYVAIQTDQGNMLNKIVSEARTNNIVLPFPVRPGQAIDRFDLYAMYASAGVAQPDTITIARIPVTTDFSRVASVEPLNPQAPTINPLAPQLMSPPVVEDPNNSYFAISMPSIGVSDLKISHPTDLTHNGLLAPLQTGVGHLFSYPGQNGKILVYGHSSSYPWDTSEFTKIFRQINKLSVGDKVYVNYHGTLYTYQVTFKQTVDAKDTSAYNQEGKEELILYTCWPPDSIKQRYLVHANLVETAPAK